MEVSELKPFEKVLDQVGCQRGNQPGVMIITNCRILWKPSAEASFPVQIYRAPISEDGGGRRLEVASAPNKKKNWVLKIAVPETNESASEQFFFRFMGPSSKQSCEKVVELLK